MATETKRISVNAIERAMKAVGEETIVELDWYGEKLIVKRRLPIGEMVAFVAAVADNCFDEDGNYLPEFRDFVQRCVILEMYGNLRLPKNVESRYEMVYSQAVCDALTMIMQNIDGAQFKEIINGIDERIDYRINTDTKMAEREVLATLSSLKELENQLMGIFSDMNADELKGLIETLAHGVDEEKLMQAYIDRQAQIAPNEGSTPQLEVIEGGEE